MKKLVLIAVLAGAAVACGGSDKPAVDPSTAATTGAEGTKPEEKKEGETTPAATGTTTAPATGEAAKPEEKK